MDVLYLSVAEGSVTTWAVLPQWRTVSASCVSVLMIWDSVISDLSASQAVAVIQTQMSCPLLVCV